MKLKAIIISSLTVAIFFISGSKARGAEMFVSPSGGSVASGETFAVTVNVSSGKETVNAVSGSLVFPKEKLSVLSLSKAGSIINFWPEDPAFSGSLGEINFEGVVLNPGFSGTSGKVITVLFRARAEGRADLVFGSGSILANDGNGTEVLSAKRGASFIVTAVKSPAEQSQAILPLAERQSTDSKIPTPELDSSTHPQDDRWYSSNNIKISWNLPDGVSGVRLSLDRESDGKPSVSYKPAIGEKEVASLGDGIWYFHADFIKGEAKGRVAHRMIKIDAKPPENISVTEVSRKDKTDPRVVFSVSAKDETSGIARYEARIDGNLIESWSAGDRDLYVVPPLLVGKHGLKITAFDEAGNFTSREAIFEIEPLETPTLNLRKDPGNFITIYGSSIPGARVLLKAGRDDNDVWVHEIPVSEDGTFVFVYKNDSLTGTYRISASARDYRGARSLSSKERVVYVGPKFSFLSSDLSLLREYSIWIILLVVALITGIFVSAGFLRRGRRSLKRKSLLGGVSRRGRFFRD